MFSHEAATEVPPQPLEFSVICSVIPFPRSRHILLAPATVFFLGGDFATKISSGPPPRV